MIDDMNALTPWVSRTWPLLTSVTAVILLTNGILAGCSLSRNASDATPAKPMTTQAGGTFEVSLTPQGLPDVSEGTTLGRMSIDKTFRGDLEATSKGEMLSVRTSTEGSAGYVAIERIIGTLQGRHGGFVLQHFAVMSRGLPHQTLKIVPDSGSGELKGISGTMTIDIVDGKHFYELVYALKESD